MADLGWLFAWAKENGIECPNKDGAADIPKLLRLYNESRAKSGGKEYRQNESDEKTAYDSRNDFAEQKKRVRSFRQNASYESIVGNEKADSYSLPDEIIPRSLSAKWRNYDIVLPNGKTAHFAEGSKMQNKEVFAGKGCKRKIDEVDRLVQEYGDPAESWMKVKANAVLVDEDGEERRAEIHWYEAKESEKQEIKFKRWLK